jgi:hypothetical protein
MDRLPLASARACASSEAFLALAFLALYVYPFVWSPNFTWLKNYAILYVDAFGRSRYRPPS